MKKHLILTIILLSPLLWAQTPVVTPSTPSVNPTVTTDIEFLLDASGSMNAMADGESQITIAKRSLKETIATIPAGTSVAFRAYSHRIPQADKVASCQDTELLIPFQPLNTMNFSASVDAIQAKGWTPIAYSLKAAGTDFQSRESHTATSRARKCPPSRAWPYPQACPWRACERCAGQIHESVR